jgi:PAS domain S-box-containing protein
MDNQASLPLRVLLVEDSTSDTQLILRQLERDGLTVECRRVDNEADFRAALSWTPDLILSDYSLPNFNGLRALQITKQQGLDIPFILVSGAVGEDVIVNVIKQGADDYVMKDRLTRLGSAIHNALEQKRLREEKKRSDDALHESQERYRLITQYTEDIIWTMDMDLHFTYISPSLERALGYTSSEIMALPFESFLTPESLANGLNAFAEEIEKAQPQPDPSYARVLEMEYRRKDHSTFWVEMKFSFFRDANGQPTGILGVGRDLARRKQMEEDLVKAEAKYRTLVEQIPPIVYIAGLEQHVGVTYVSPQIKTLGFTQEEWLADPTLWFRRIHPEDQQRVMADIERNKGSHSPFQSEYRLTTRDGNTRWFLDEAMDVVDGNGVPLFRQGFMLDITARKNAEEALASRERYLVMLNNMTRAILLSKDFDSTLYTLAENLAKLIDADDCFIARWDDERQTVTPVAGTMNLEGPRPSYRDTQPEDLKMVLSVLNVRHALAADDAYNSPYVNLKLAKELRLSSALGIPLIAGEHKLGAAVIVFKEPHHFTPDEIEHAEQAGDQIALALWNFQQGTEIQQRLRESTTLGKIERALSESERIGTGEVLQLIVDSARELMPHAEKSVIHLLDVEEQTLQARAVSGFDDQERENKGFRMRLGEGIAGRVIHEGITINIGDVGTNPNFLPSESTPSFQSLLVAPVKGSGQQIGTISVQSNQPNAFTNKDADLLKALAVQAAIAIENTRLFETTQQSLKEVNILYQISRGLAASLDADQLIRDTIALLQQFFGYYHVQIYLLDPETRELVVKHGSGYIGNQLLQSGHHIPAGDGIVGHVAETGEPFVTNNVDAVVFFKRNPLLPQTQSEIAVPIKIGQHVSGILDIQQIAPHRFADNDLQLMTAIADQLAVVLQKANLYSTLQTSLQQEQMIRSQLLQSERLALVGRLLASVSHELNNPLQAIQNALFLLKEEAGLSEQGHQDLGIVLSETERMAALIERLRSAYRPIRDKDFQPVQLNNLIEDVYALISTHMRHKGIVFEFIPDPDLLEVSGISDQLRQVVLNLFLNAIEVMGPGGRLTVQTQNLIEQNEVLFTVKDTGPGIEAEILPRIFDAFITSKHTGTGLGLTITHDILQQHRGRISAENNPEGGAIFHVWLPMYEKE